MKQLVAVMLEKEDFSDGICVKCDWFSRLTFEASEKVVDADLVLCKGEMVKCRPSMKSKLRHEGYRTEGI